MLIFVEMTDLSDRIWIILRDRFVPADLPPENFAAGTIRHLDNPPQKQFAANGHVVP